MNFDHGERQQEGVPSIAGLGGSAFVRRGGGSVQVRERRGTGGGEIAPVSGEERREMAHRYLGKEFGDLYI